MIFFMVSICIAFSFGANIGNRSDTDGSSQLSDPNYQQEQFEVISLNAFDIQTPLFIRSRVPGTLRLSKDDSDNGGKNIFAQQSIEQVEADILDSLESLQARSQLSSSTLSLSETLSDSVNEAQSSTSNSGLNMLQTVNIGSITDFTSLLSSESTFGAMAMPLELNNPKNSEYIYLTPQQKEKSNSIALITAELLYSTVGRTDLENNNHQQDSASQTKDLQPNVSRGINESTGYTIEKVPEVASYDRFGPYSPSDIPSISEIEAIFDNATENTADVNQTSEDYSQHIEGRSGFEENDVESNSIANITKNLAEQQDSFIDTKLYNIVNISNSQDASNQLASVLTDIGKESKVISDAILNEINKTTEHQTIANNVSSKLEKNIPQSFSDVVDANILSTLDISTVVPTARQSVSKLDGNDKNNKEDSMNIGDRINNTSNEATTSSLKEVKQEILGIDEDKNSLMVPAENNNISSNILSIISTDDLIQSYTEAEIILSDAVTHTRLTESITESFTETDAPIKITTLEAEGLQHVVPISNNKNMSSLSVNNETNVNIQKMSESIIESTTLMYDTTYIPETTTAINGENILL